MRHAAHKAGSARSARRMDSSSFSDYLAGARGRRGAAAVEAAGSGSAMAFTPVVDAALADKLNEVAPQTRRAMRQAAKACARKNHIMAGSALAVLFGAAAGAVAFANPFSGVDGGRLAVADARQSAVQVTNGSTADAASRSQSRAALDGDGAEVSAANVDGDQSQDSTDVLDDSLVDGSSDSSNGSWSLWDSNTELDVSQTSKSLADNPQVAALMEQNAADIPAGFNPNHATNDYGSSYAFSQCTWWAYTRRHQLGLPVGTHYGNGYMWADSARSLGYWVDDTPRNVGDIMVFRQGQEGASSAYGHVAIVEAINPDGSITTSECGASYHGKTFSRTFTNVHDFQYIHY